MKVKVNGNTVTATVELEEGRPSSTGKSTILFTTGGYVPIAEGMRISINIIAPNDKDGRGSNRAPTDNDGKGSRHKAEQGA